MRSRNDYELRDYLLIKLGYPSYSDYLKSELWRTIRTKVLDNAVCWVCKRKAQQVHHEKYCLENLRGDKLWGLLPVCRRHHQLAEMRGGDKTSLAEANSYLKKKRDRLLKLEQKHGRLGLARQPRAKRKNRPFRPRPDVDETQRARDLQRLEEIKELSCRPRKRSDVRQERPNRKKVKTEKKASHNSAPLVVLSLRAKTEEDAR